MPLVTSLFKGAVTFSSGADRFSRDVEAMIGHPISKWWLICWKYLSPLMVLVGLFVLNLVPKPSPIGNEIAFLLLLCKRYLLTPGVNKSSVQTVVGFVTHSGKDRLRDDSSTSVCVRDLGTRIR